MMNHLERLISKLRFKEVFSFSLVAVFFFLVSSASATSHLTGHKIVIDPGHGGDDSGSTACVGYAEKDANLDVARLLRDKLEDSGATVYMTRDDDGTYSNRYRYEKANSTDGEVLLSIHLNGSTDKSVDGTLGLYGKRNKDLEFTKAVHANMSADLSIGDFDVPDMGVTNFASGVLLKSEMPATIQETVFISNTDECDALKKGADEETFERQEQIAQALFNGLENWFSQTTDDGGGDEDSDGNNGKGNGKDCTEPPCNNK